MSVTIALSEIRARARTIATEMGLDANQSVTIDNAAGLRSLLNHCLNEIFRRKASDQKFLRDITRNTAVAMTTGSGAVPDTIMREFLHFANFADNNGSLITYYNFAADYNSGQNFNQLGYCYVEGDNFVYTPPNGTATSYTGNLFVTTPTIPAITTSVTFPSQATADDVILMLARAIRAEEKFEIIDAV